MIRYQGDSIRFQAPTKEWVRVTYECAFDPVALKVDKVTVRLGRLDRPPEAAQAASRARRQAGQPVRPPGRNALAGQRPLPAETSSTEVLQVDPAKSPKR